MSDKISRQAVCPHCSFTSYQHDSLPYEKDGLSSWDWACRAVGRRRYSEHLCKDGPNAGQYSHSYIVHVYDREDGGEKLPLKQAQARAKLFDVNYVEPPEYINTYTSTGRLVEKFYANIVRAAIEAGNSEK
jgi:hypothetical protein